MLSQIQPHFLYNSLTAIRQLCNIDPQKAKQTGTLPRLYLACGTEDSLFPNNTVMRKELEGLGADVTWFQGPGAHSWQFWDQEIKKAVPWMLNAEKQEVDDETQRV